MSIFTLKLTEEQHAALEAYRAERGLRSKAEAVRHLIMSSPSVVRSVMAPNAMILEGVKLGAPLKLADEPAVAWGENSSISFGPQRPKPGDRLKKGLSK